MNHFSKMHLHFGKAETPGILGGRNKLKTIKFQGLLVQKVSSAPLQHIHRKFHNGPHFRGSVPCLDHVVDP